MNWATKIIEKLKNGETVTFRAWGNSMDPMIKNGQNVIVEPTTIDKIKKGDVVLCRVKGSNYLHLVKSFDNRMALIANNRGHINGWTRTVYGKFIGISNE